MISRDYYRKVHIDITYIKKPVHYRKRINHDNMNYNPDNTAQNRFICSICLNKRPLNVIKNADPNKRTAKSCPICRCGAVQMETEDSEPEKAFHNKYKSKHVQTSQTDVPQSISLLNEVLNVFQNRKCDAVKGKPVICKDVAVNTDVVKVNKIANLVMSETFHYSIENDSKIKGEGKFTILNHIPRKVEKTIALAKHKSSSIPQMKLEELKHSLKEKTKSKDAIEEVNRMFATVRKFDLDSNESNRPVFRNGPRILPVVKTKNYEEENMKLCQEHKMSAGDSVQQINKQNHCCKTERCSECLYMCCHYQHYKCNVCENCQKLCNLGHMERV